MTTAVILTCRRAESGFDYFKQTWAGVADAWKNRIEERIRLAPAVLLDVTTDHDPQGAEEIVRMIVGEGVVVRVFSAPGGLGGNKLAYWAAMKLAVESTADDLLILEDDVEFAGNAFLRMLTFPLPPDLDFVSFFCPHILAGTKKPWAGLWRVPAPFYSTVAVKFRRETVERLILWATMSPVDFMALKSGDQTLDRAKSRLGLHFGIHVPELVEHRGVESTNGDEPNEFRRAHTWPGPTFDSMSLYSRHELFL